MIDMIFFIEGGNSASTSADNELDEATSNDYSNGL